MKCLQFRHQLATLCLPPVLVEIVYEYMEKVLIPSKYVQYKVSRGVCRIGQDIYHCKDDCLWKNDTRLPISLSPTHRLYYVNDEWILVKSEYNNVIIHLPTLRGTRLKYIQYVFVANGVLWVYEDEPCKIDGVPIKPIPKIDSFWSISIRGHTLCYEHNEFECTFIFDTNDTKRMKHVYGVHRKNKLFYVVGNLYLQHRSFYYPLSDSVINMFIAEPYIIIGLASNKLLSWDTDTNEVVEIIRDNLCFSGNFLYSKLDNQVAIFE